MEAMLLALSHVQELTLDIMAFTIVKHLVDTAENPLDHHANFSNWLLYIAEFAATFFKKFYQTDL